MDTKETHKVQSERKVLMSDEHYFSYIFKKTEKIVCAVFYILQFEKDNKGHNARIVDTVESVAQGALDAVIATLSLEEYEAQKELTEAQRALVTLGSNINIARSAGVIRTDLADTLSYEIEGVLRSIRNHTSGQASQFDFTETPSKARVLSKPTPSSTASSATPVNPAQKGRKERILQILSSKGQSSIRDIADEIKDCSEKTVQRELIALIKDGSIKKEGERRWSRYSVV